jgi:hypothetical protein
VVLLVMGLVDQVGAPVSSSARSIRACQKCLIGDGSWDRSWCSSPCMSASQRALAYATVSSWNTSVLPRPTEGRRPVDQVGPTAGE